MWQFLVIVIISCLALLVVQPFVMINGDEGIFVHHATLLEEGIIPIADYTTRAPILLLTMFITGKLFGLSIFVFRLPMIVFTAIASGLIFLFAQELFSRRVGLWSAFLFALSPFTLWHGVVIKSETLAVVMMLLAALFIVRGLKRYSNAFIFLGGILTGLSYIERHSTIAFMGALGLWFLWEYVWKKRDVKAFLVKGIYLASGFVTGFLSVFLVIAYYNFGAAMQAWLSPFFISGLGSTKDSLFGSSSALFAFLRLWTLSFVESFAIRATLVFAGLFSFFGMLLVWWKRGIGYSFVLAVFLVTILHSIKIIQIGVMRPKTFLFMSLVLLLFFISFFVLHRWRENILEYYKNNTDSVFFLTSWVLVLLVAYSFFDTGYSRELMPLASIAGAIIIAMFPWNSTTNSLRLSFTVLLGAMFLVGVSWFQDPRTGGWWWRQDTIREAAMFLQRAEKRGDVFASNPFPVVLSDRHVFMDFYTFSFPIADAFGVDSWGRFPSSQTVLETLKEEAPPYIIVDGRLERHVFDIHPEFEEHIKKNYVKEAMFGTYARRDWVEVWGLIP